MNNLSEAIDQLENLASQLEDAKTDEAADAASTMESISYDLEAVAYELRQMAEKLSEAADILD